MRTIYLINTVTGKHISEYSSRYFETALDDIAGNGYKAIDIKFDMDGDVVIYCIPVLWGDQMLKANVEARIEQKQHERDQILEQIQKLDKLIENLKTMQHKLLDKDTDLCYELEELQDELLQDPDWRW